VAIMIAHLGRLIYRRIYLIGFLLPLSLIGPIWIYSRLASPARPLERNSTWSCSLSGSPLAAESLTCCRFASIRALVDHGFRCHEMIRQRAGWRGSLTADVLPSARSSPSACRGPDPGTRRSTH
jgi:hypothetical protein